MPQFIITDLIYHTGALGDFITAIPAIQFYKKQNPGKKLTLLGRPSIGAFAKEIGLVDDWLDADGRKYLPLFYDVYSQQAEDLLTGISSVILFTSPDSPLLRNIRQSRVKPLLWQPPFPSSQTHVVDYHLSLFGDPEKFKPADRIPRVVPSASAIETIKKLLHANQKPVAIHPGSGSRKKNWPFEKFLALADHFRSKKIPLLWIKGPAEENLIFPNEDQTASSLPFSILAAVFARCSAFIGNDSGVTHLAAAVGCPTVAIFGPSDPEVWGPRGERVRIIRDNADFSFVKGEDVVQKARALIH